MRNQVWLLSSHQADQSHSVTSVSAQPVVALLVVTLTKSRVALHLVRAYLYPRSPALT